MSQEEIVRQLQASQQKMTAELAREKQAELELEDARLARQRLEGEVGLWTALLQQEMQQQATERQAAQAKPQEVTNG